jgi:integrase
MYGGYLVGTMVGMATSGGRPMAKRYSEGTVRYRVRRGKDGIERGHWEALLKVSDGGSPWRSKSKAIKDYPKQTADGRTVRAEILSPTKSRPNQGREGALAALAEWRGRLMADDEAEERKARQAELGAGDAAILSVGADSTVYEYVDVFVSSRKIRNTSNPAGIARSTYDGYRYAIRSMDEGFGNTKIRDLKPARILAWQKSLEHQGKAGATINRAYWCLKNACEYAVQNGDMDAEQFALCFPRKRVDAPKSANPDPNPLDDSSLELLNLLIDRANAQGDPSAFMVCVELALLTGMRQSEVCGLRWRDVDLEGSGQYPHRLHPRVQHALALGQRVRGEGAQDQGWQPLHPAERRPALPAAGPPRPAGPRDDGRGGGPHRHGRLAAARPLRVRQPERGLLQSDRAFAQLALLRPGQRPARHQGSPRGVPRP